MCPHVEDATFALRYIEGCVYYEITEVRMFIYKGKLRYLNADVLNDEWPEASEHKI